MDPLRTSVVFVVVGGDRMRFFLAHMRPAAFVCMLAIESARV